MFVAVAAGSVLALAACSGGGPEEGAPEGPAPGVEAPEGDSDGGGVVDAGEGEADADEGLESTGSPLGDSNREEYLDMGYTLEELEGIAWAGDVATDDGSFVEYPDGLRVEFAGVEPGSAPVSEENGDLDPDRDLVRVSLTVSNDGPEALPIDGDYDPFDLFEGEGLTSVSSHVGYFGEEDDLYSENEDSVIAPGSEVDVYASYEVEPGAALEVSLRPDFFGLEHTPFVFYGFTAP